MSPTLRFHAAAGTAALALISTFWLSTVLVELWGDPLLIARTKSTILTGFLLLVPALAATGLTGARLGRGWRLPVIARKQRRMAIAAANGLVVLIPAAVFLAARAEAGVFDGWFVAVQTLELAAGALNITLLGLNLRDGLALRRRRPA